MPNEMQQVLAEIFQPQVTWIIGKVDRVTGDTVTLLVNGGYVPNVGCSDQYVPVVGDIVHAISWEPNGVLVLCSNNQPGAPPSTGRTPTAPLIVTPTSSSVYNSTTGTWSAGTGAGPTLTKVWFYGGSAFTAMSSEIIGTVEIELTRTAGGPPEMVALSNASASGLPTPIVQGSRYGGANTAAGVPSWLPLPLDWGKGLASGAIKSIGVGGALYAGTYTGTGRIRITPL